LRQHVGVPPLSLALRGGSFLYQSRSAMNSVDLLSADAKIGTNKIGVWGRRAQHAKA
jgi:hypothetical protein